MIDLTEKEVPTFAKEKPAPIQRPMIYGALIQAKKHLTAIGKNGRVTEYGSYDYRRFDDVLNAVAPLLNDFGILISGEVISKEERQDGKKHFVTLTKEFRLWAEDGSFVTHSTIGEAFDVGDKAATKAQTVAYRIMLVEVFNIPYEDMQDPESGEQGEWSDNTATVVRFSKDIDNCPSVDLLRKIFGKVLDAFNKKIPNIALEKHEVKALLPKFEAKCKGLNGDAERLRFSLLQAIGETPSDPPAIAEEQYGFDEINMLFKNAVKNEDRENAVAKASGSICDGVLNGEQIAEIVGRHILPGPKDEVCGYYFGAILDAKDRATVGSLQSDLGGARLGNAVRAALQRLAQHRMSGLK